MTTDTPCPPCRSEHTDAPLLQGSGGGPTAPCSTEPKRDAAASAARKDTLARVILLEHARGCSSRTCAFGVDCSKMRIVLAHASTCPGFTEESGPAHGGGTCGICKRLRWLVTQRDRLARASRGAIADAAAAAERERAWTTTPPASATPAQQTVARSAPHAADVAAQAQRETDRLLARASALAAARGPEQPSAASAPPRAAEALPSTAASSATPAAPVAAAPAPGLGRIVRAPTPPLSRPGESTAVLALSALKRGARPKPPDCTLGAAAVAAAAAHLSSRRTAADDRRAAVLEAARAAARAGLGASAPSPAARKRRRVRFADETSEFPPAIASVMTEDERPAQRRCVSGAEVADAVALERPCHAATASAPQQHPLARNDPIVSDTF